MDIYGAQFNEENIQSGVTQTNTNYGGYGIAASKVSWHATRINWYLTHVSYFHLGFVHHKDTKIRFPVSLKKITVDVIVEQILNFIFVTIMLRKTRLLSGYCVGLQVEGSLQDHFQCCVFPNTWSMGG